MEGDDGGSRLDRFLSSRLPEITRARLKVLIDEGRASIEGRAAKAGQRVKPGQIVQLTVPAPEPSSLEPDASVRFSIIYEDADILVIDKPPGLVVHPAAGHESGTLVHGLLSAVPDLPGINGERRPGIVHRLDKDTSGVLVTAKTEIAQQRLSEAFQSRDVSKCYVAICRGRPVASRGEVDAPIGRHPVRRKEMSVRSRNGRPALTRWRVNKRFAIGAALLDVEILTGRTHQIRVHLASIGLPVLGDPVYGRGVPADGRWAAVRSLATRQMLHAARIALRHPVSGELMTFSAPLPEDMTNLLKILESSEAPGKGSTGE